MARCLVKHRDNFTFLPFIRLSYHVWGKSVESGRRAVQGTKEGFPRVVVITINTNTRYDAIPKKLWALGPGYDCI